MLAAAVNLLWWLEWIAGGLCMVRGGMAAYIRKGFALQVPISYSATTIGQIRPLEKNGSVGILNATDGTLSVHIGANWHNIGMLLIGYGLLFAVIVTITYQFKKILQSFKRDQPFQRSNVSRIKKIALILIGYSLVQWLFIIAVNQILISNFQFKHLDLTYDFNSTCLLVGVVLLVVEGIFKTGLSLEEDKQLTI
ncbi:MAG: hypothetical protein JWP78_1035 [Mucilaginibacter sp.]|nr:hypothetical protein [Mucilaginibacter sp.]